MDYAREKLDFYCISPGIVPLMRSTMEPTRWYVRVRSPCWSLICRKDWSRPREHSAGLRDLELWLVWKGRGWMRSRKQEYPLLPGFCAIMRPGGIYDAGHEETNPLGIAFIHFQAFRGRDSAPLPAKTLAKWPEFYQLEDVDFIHGVMRRIIRLEFLNPAAASGLLQGLLLDLLKRPLFPKAALSAHQSRRSTILSLAEEIRSATDAPVPGVSAMAASVGLSLAHFSRLFHEVIGQSPRDFVLDIRLRRARHLLMECDLTVQEIAERLGYRDPFFFSRQFREKIGMPPNAYRRGKLH